MSTQTSDGYALVVLDVRADGYMLDCFDPDSVEGDQPDEAVSRQCTLHRGDLPWVVATALAEVDRMRLSRNWPAVHVVMDVDQTLDIGGPVHRRPEGEEIWPHLVHLPHILPEPVDTSSLPVEISWAPDEGFTVAGPKVGPAPEADDRRSAPIGPRP